jgi:hypothetical protein
MHFDSIVKKNNQMNSNSDSDVKSKIQTYRKESLFLKKNVLFSFKMNGNITLLFVYILTELKSFKK